jgi:Lipocalin-like domain
MINNPLIGTWKLKSLETRTTDGSVSYPYGRQVRGYVIFSPEGYFSATIMNANREKFPSQDMRGGSIEQKAEAADSCLCYAGPYETEKDKFRIKVEVSLFPNWIGTTQERSFKIEGKTLSVIIAPILLNGREQRGHLIFEHV